jgi:hypothetical protein
MVIIDVKDCTEKVYDTIFIISIKKKSNVAAEVINHNTGSNKILSASKKEYTNKKNNPA